MNDGHQIEMLGRLAEGSREQAAETADQPTRDAWLGLANAAERVERQLRKQQRQVYLPAPVVH